MSFPLQSTEHDKAYQMFIFLPNQTRQEKKQKTIS